MSRENLLQNSSNMRFKQFQPRATEPGLNAGMNYESDFSFNPQKFFCKTHTSNEVEFCCEINNTFYCKKC